MKIGWVLSGNRHIAGARLQGFLMHEEFLRRGIDSSILHYPEHYDTDVPFEVEEADRWIGEGFTCIIFQKVFSDRAERLARRLSQAGVRTVYVACNLQGHAMVAACDATIAVSTFLKRAFGRRYQHKITMIEDPIEVPENIFKRDYALGGAEVRAVYVAGEPPSPYLLGLIGASASPVELREISSPRKVGKKTAEPNNVATTGEAHNAGKWAGKLDRLRQIGGSGDLGWKLKWAFYRRLETKRIKRGEPSAETQFRHIDWDLDTVYAHILEADIAVIPCELQYEWSLAKSGNRLLMFTALGMPVIASPLPAYRELVKEVGGPYWMIAQTREDWRKAYARLADEGVRREMGGRFKDFARREYGIERVAERYLSVVES